jgi:hypothetical protein
LRKNKQKMFKIEDHITSQSKIRKKMKPRKLKTIIMLNNANFAITIYRT